MYSTEDQVSKEQMMKWKKEELSHSLKRIQDFKVDLMSFPQSPEKDKAVKSIELAEESLEVFYKSLCKDKPHEPHEG